MNIPLNPAPAGVSLEALHAGFLSILPRVRLHAEVYFRHLKCPHKKEDAVQETLAIAWKWYARATEQGKAPSPFVTTRAGYAPRHVKNGRRLCGQERSKDVISPLAQ